MTRQQIEHVFDQVEAEFPSLRMSDRPLWTRIGVARCYAIDQTVGLKRADPHRPISDDTIAIASAPVPGAAGQEIPMSFEAVDLVAGSTGQRQWSSYGIVSQIFIIPAAAQAPAPVPTKPTYPPYAGDPAFDAVGVMIFAQYAEAHRAPDEQCGRWFGRIIYDWLAEVVPTLDDSIRKHKAELRQELHLPS